MRTSLNTKAAEMRRDLVNCLKAPGGFVVENRKRGEVVSIKKKD